MKNIITKSFKVLAIFALVSFFGMPSFADVNPDGSFGHTVPIDLPPGTNGMQPGLALVYNSNSGNGMLGVGWQLAGLPLITRDTTYPINYNGTDHYVGPNGRLVKSNGNIYRYQNDNFTKVEMIPFSGTNEPKYWKETRTDGTVFYYGMFNLNEGDYSISLEVNSGFFASNGYKRAWGLCMAVDVNGNYYTVEYSNNNGEYYPEKITYTNNLWNPLGSFRTVEFEYSKPGDSDARTDYGTMYTYKTAVTTQWRMKQVITEVDEDTRTYTLAYDNGTAIGCSRLINVEDSGNIDAITSFEWQDSICGLSYNGNYTLPYVLFDYNHLGDGKETQYGELIDINGDGLVDQVVAFKNAGGTNYKYTYKNISTFSNLLTSLHPPIGSTTTIIYTPAPQVSGAIVPSSSAYPNIANTFPRNLVTRVVTTDGRGAEYKKDYEYYNGKYHTGYTYERQDLLFERIREYTSGRMSASEAFTSGNRTDTYYSQVITSADDPLTGKINNIYVYNKAGTCIKDASFYNKTVTITHPSGLTTKYAAMDFTNTQEYESGSVVFSRTERHNSYNEYGAPTQITSSASGLTDIVTNIEYSHNESAWQMNRPSVITQSTGGTPLKKQLFEYSGVKLISKSDYLGLPEKVKTA